MNGLRKLLLAVSVFGAILSVSGYGIVHFGRYGLEDGAREVVVAWTEQEIREFLEPRPVEEGGRLAALRNRAVEAAAAAVRHAFGEDYPERLRQRLAELCICRMSPAEVEATLAAYERGRAEVKRAVIAALDGRLQEARLAPGTFGDLVDGYYVNTVEGLVRDLRIFFGLNIVIYMLVAVAGRLGGESRPILGIAGILLFSNLVAGAAHLFAQDWLATILLNNWLGYGYLILVAVLFVYLCFRIGLLLVQMRVERAVGL